MLKEKLLLNDFKKVLFEINRKNICNFINYVLEYTQLERSVINMIKLNNNKYEYFDSNSGLIALFLTI